jgi:hypothetical protein
MSDDGKVYGDMHAGALPSLRDYMLDHGFVKDISGLYEPWNSAECQKLIDDYPETQPMPEPK